MKTSRKLFPLTHTRVASGPPARTMDPADVAVPDLRGHRPSVVAQTQEDTITYWAFTRDGVAQRRFTLDDSWSDWQLFGYPTNSVLPAAFDSFGKSIPLTSGKDGSGDLQFAAFAYPSTSGESELALLYSSALGRLDTEFDWKTLRLPSGLIPRSINTDREFRAQAIVPDDDSHGFTAYGTTGESMSPSVYGEQLLLEFSASYTQSWPDPTQITTGFANHGRPKIDGDFRNVVLGPGGVVRVPIQSRASSSLEHFVFVKAMGAPNDYLTWLRRDQHGDAEWQEDLGIPPGTNGRIVDAPVALTTTLPDGVRINVFVVAYHMEEERYMLFGREWNLREGTRGSWGGWQSYEWPVDEDSGQPLFYGDTPFRLTTYAVWKHKGKTMINLFGWGNAEGADRPARLIEFLYDGSRWRWSGKHLPPQPELGMTTQSMAVIVRSGKTYFSLMCRSSDGNVWEHHYTGGDRKWEWRDMSR